MCRISFDHFLPGLQTTQDGWYRVHGTEGTLELGPAFGYQGIKMKSQLANQPPTPFDAGKRDPAHFSREADYFSFCILSDLLVKPSGEEGLRDMRWMAEICKAEGLSYA